MGKEEKTGQRRLVVLLGLFTVAAICVSGCSGIGKTFVMKPFDAPVRATSLNIVEGKSSVQVPSKTRELFQSEVKELLYADFKEGHDVTIRYEFVECRPGNRFKRWLCGDKISRCGEGILRVQASYIDSHGTELAEIQAVGDILTGAGGTVYFWPIVSVVSFGGSFNHAVKKAAEEIAQYTRVNMQ